MFHSRSMTDLDAQSGSSSGKSSFESGSKNSGRLVAGDTRHAEMFVRDNLTSGFVPPASPLAGIFDAQHGQKPLSKYDPNTGKFYRSVALDTASIPSSLSALSLLSLFASDDMRYNTTTHTGTVINLAGQITVTCVGDTHVQTDALYAKVQETLAALLNSRKQQENDGTEGMMDSVMGVSLVQSGCQGLVEKDCDLVADSSAGITLFSNADASKKQPKRMHMDTCGGMTLFSFTDEDELSEVDTVTSVGTASPAGSPTLKSTLQQTLIDTVAGLTFFRSERKQMQLDNLVADTMCGMTLYSSPDQQAFPEDVSAETCGGITTFRPCNAKLQNENEGASEQVDEACHIASDSVMGFTDFGPGLSKLRQDPEKYTEEQKWLSDLAWAVCA